MKSKIILPSLCVVLLLLHLYLPSHKAAEFITAIESADPGRINAALPADVSFGKDPQLSDWYAFYWRSRLVAGPFPLADYGKPVTMNLKMDAPSLQDWLLGRRSVRVFGRQYTKVFTISYSGISYQQGPDPQGQAK